MINGITKEMINNVMAELNAIFKEIAGIDDMLTYNEEAGGVMLATPFLLSKGQIEEFVISQGCANFKSFIKQSGFEPEEIIKDIMFLVLSSLNNNLMTMMQNFPGDRFTQYVESLDKLAEMEAAEDKEQKLRGLLGTKETEN